MNAVLLFPGQGSQKPGMGKDLAGAYGEARDVFGEVDEALGTSLSSLCFEGPAGTLTDTRNAQPALLTHGAAVWSVVGSQLGLPLAVAGHSLGEWTAHCIGGTFGVAAAARLVRQRGVLMGEAAGARPGTMAAILGDLSRDVDAICHEASGDPEGGLVVPANYNSPGQVVISGEIAGVERAMELAKAAGARRAIRLAVSGAFHSPLMAPARDGVAAALGAATLNDPRCPVYANVNAEPVTDAATARRLLIEQLTAPVRWTQIIERLAARFPDAVFVEMGPGSVLTGLTRKIAPAVRAVTCGTAPEVEALLAMQPA